MAYRIGLKKNEKLNSYENLVKLFKILDNSDLSDVEVLQKTQGINMQTKKNHPFKSFFENIKPLSESLTFRQEKYSSPIVNVNRSSKHMQKQTTNPIGKKML